jgi:hypothetical protein
MAITIKVGDQEKKEQGPKMPESIKIKVGPIPYGIKPKQASMTLMARKTLEGNVMIFDHNEIDIVLMPKKKKIVAFPKELMSEQVYDAQDRLFRFLTKKGIINPETVRGGAVFMSMEAVLPDSKETNVNEMALFSIGKFIEEEKPHFEFEKAYEEAEEERLTEPLPGEYTEFDPEEYHSTSKGSMAQCAWVGG